MMALIPYTAGKIIPNWDRTNAAFEKESKELYNDIMFRYFLLTYITPRLLNPGGSIQHPKGSSIISILSRINSIPRIDTYFFKVYYYPPIYALVYQNVILH